MNNSKPETTVTSNTKPEIGSPTVKDASGAPVNPPKPVSDDDKNALKDAKSSAPATSSTR